MLNVINAAAIVMSLVACNRPVEYDPKTLGFADNAEMDTAFAKGYHTKQKLTEMLPPPPAPEAAVTLEAPAVAPVGGANATATQAIGEDSVAISPPQTPAVPDDLLSKAAHCGDVNACIAVMLEAVDPRRPEAISVAATRISEQSKASRGDRKQARVLNTKGLEEFKKGNFNGAIDLLMQAAAADPADVEVLSNLGFVSMQANNNAEAEKALIAALLIDPRRTSAWVPYAEVTLSKGKSDDAVRALLLGFEFSGNKEKTFAVFEEKSTSAEREAMRPAYSTAVQKIRATNPSITADVPAQAASQPKVVPPKATSSSTSSPSSPPQNQGSKDPTPEQVFKMFGGMIKQLEKQK
jgi:hypothetical protein